MNLARFISACSKVIEQLESSLVFKSVVFEENVCIVLNVGLLFQNST